jgi:hypothetical protein
MLPDKQDRMLPPGSIGLKMTVRLSTQLLLMMTMTCIVELL